MPRCRGSLLRALRPGSARRLQEGLVARGQHGDAEDRRGDPGGEQRAPAPNGQRSWQSRKPAATGPTDSTAVMAAVTEAALARWKPARTSHSATTPNKASSDGTGLFSSRPSPRQPSVARRSPTSLAQIAVAAYRQPAAAPSATPLWLRHSRVPAAQAAERAGPCRRPADSPLGPATRSPEGADVTTRPLPSTTR
jgi:hypothetical protein